MILLDPSLVTSLLLDANIEMEVKGSDHCPIWARLKYPSEIEHRVDVTVPRNAMQFHPKFAVKQVKLTSLFQKKGGALKSSTSSRGEDTNSEIDDGDDDVGVAETSEKEEEEERKAESVASVWVCERCTLHNDPSVSKCEACNNLRLEKKKPKSGPKQLSLSFVKVREKRGNYGRLVTQSTTLNEHMNVPLSFVLDCSDPSQEDNRGEVTSPYY